MSDDTTYHSIAVAFWRHRNGEIRATALYRTNGQVDPETVQSPRSLICSNIIVIANTGKDPRPGIGHPSRSDHPLWQLMPLELLPKELKPAFAEACTRLVIKAYSAKAGR